MNLDPNIILQARQQQDPLETYAKLMNLKQMANQNYAQEAEQQKKQQMQDLIKQNTKTGPDGRFDIDYDSASQQAMQSGNSEAAMAMQKMFQEHGLEKMKFGTDTMKMLLSSGDNNSMDEIKKQAMKLGVPNADKLPDTATPEQFQAIQARTLDIDKQLGLAKDQQKSAMDQERFAFEKQKHRDDMGLKYAEAGQKEKNGDTLPLAAKKTIETLASKNANITSIQNELDAVTSKWSTMTDDEKYNAGQSLIKTMNSTQGSDAVGEGEASRLASNLDFIWSGNLFNNNPMQLGRDLPGFKKQVENISAKIKEVKRKNQEEIDSNIGRPSSKKEESKPVNLSWALPKT